MPSPELQIVIEMLRDMNPFEGDDILAMRTLVEAPAEAYVRPDDVTYEPAIVSGVPVEWITPAGAEPGRLLVYHHGGGYALCSIDTHRGLCTHLARAARARVCSVGYRLAPEHPHPAAVDDATAVYRALLADGIEPARTALGGDSAGGGLTLAALVALRDAGDPLPAAAICISPWTDLSISGESVRTRADADPMLGEAQLELMSRLYLAGGDPRSPTASPLFADLSGLPPLLVQVGTAEVLLDDSVRLADRARIAGVEMELETWDDMIHVWHSFADLLPEGREAIAGIGRFLDKRLR